jgi:two-component system chemotaxis response regulator CheB
MAGHDIIVVGASIGGLEALRIMVADLPHDLPAALFVVWHIAPESPALLAEILHRAGPLPAWHPHDGEAIQASRIYVAPPDHHLLVEDGRVRLSRGPRENRFRPAIDPLFRSAASAYGPRVIGIILSGALGDGTAGMEAVKARGGIVVVQDPREAINPSMPRSVLAHVAVDHRVPAAAIGPLLADLVYRVAGEGGMETMTERLDIETRIAREDHPLEAGVMDLGKPSPYTCPECHGVLLEITTDGILRFRCHTGHAYTVNSLLAEVSGSIEETLWSAMRVIEEKVMLLHHSADRLRAQGEQTAAEQLQEQAREAEQQVELVRLAVLRHEQRMKRAVDADTADGT